MGAELYATMRTAVYFGLLVCAVALISDGSAISFDDLVARADEAQHPKKVEKAPQPDIEMEEWSTDHLLGLDAPPPADMFDSLLSTPKEHKAPKVVHKAHKAHKVVAKKVAQK